MPPSFYPRLINGLFDDPGLLITFQYEKRTVFFDLGDIHILPAKDILKTSHVFITHTHMDHWIGFDRLIRLMLGREKTLYMYGPEGFLKNIEGKLTGYSWNLVQHYDRRFSITATEIRSNYQETKHYSCHTGFLPGEPVQNRPFENILLKESGLFVSTAILDHIIPVLGYSLQERFHINIKTSAVAALNLEIGPWLNTFKHALLNNEDPNSRFEVRFGKENRRAETFVLGDLTEKIALITPGQKISYLADAVYNPSNEEKMVTLAEKADHLFIESAFLDKDREIAGEKYHLTAKQAGIIAGKARVKRFTLFHFSPRYQGQEHLIQNEATAAYNAYLG